MRTLLTAIPLLLSLSLFSQRTEKFYDYKWQETTPGHALFCSVSEKEGDLYHAMDYYIRESKLQMEGYYADSMGKLKTVHFFTIIQRANSRQNVFTETTSFTVNTWACT